MKILVLILAIMTTQSFAHDEGHGPSLIETGNYGGIMAAIMLENDIGNEEAKIHYKGELVINKKYEARFYIYDDKMKQQKLKGFPEKIRGDVEIKIAGKFKKDSFEFVKKGNNYYAQIPKPAKKPYNIDIYMSHESKNLFVGFSNLD